jgi:hypothetical protein
LKLCRHPTLALLVCLGSAAGSALAQFNPARVVNEPPAVAARFAEPDVRYSSPGLRPGRTDFPSHAEVLAFLQGLAGPRLQLEVLGPSQENRALVMAVLARGGRVDPGLPTVMILAQQHGNEPAGGEAALALAAELAGPRSALLERVNVLIVPRANPDGAERFVRTTRSGIDVNRDHLLLRTPEARALAAAAARYRPQVVLDLHEFTVAGRWVDKFNAMQRYDALLQAATVGNLDPGVGAFARGYEEQLQQALGAQGLSHFAYHTTSPDPKDAVVSMGGVQPDTGRNTGGLRPAISLLIEGRGIGIGRAHLLRRVHTQVVAAMSVIETAATQGQRLIDTVRRAEADTAARACQGELVIAAQHSATRQTLVLVDAVTGADKPIDVAWRAASPLDVQRTRPRPCGYLIAGDQQATLERLALLGARLQPVAQAARWQVEGYAITQEAGGQRQDARGAVDDGADASIRMLQVRTEARSPVVAPGSVYVGLDQPLGALIAAALEPDSQSSYAANRLLELEDGKLLRVMARPAAAWLGGVVPAGTFERR